MNRLTKSSLAVVALVLIAGCGERPRVSGLTKEVVLGLESNIGEPFMVVVQTDTRIYLSKPGEFFQVFTEEEVVYESENKFAVLTKQSAFNFPDTNTFDMGSNGSIHTTSELLAGFGSGWYCKSQKAVDFTRPPLKLFSNEAGDLFSQIIALLHSLGQAEESRVPQGISLSWKTFPGGIADRLNKQVHHSFAETIGLDELEVIVEQEQGHPILLRAHFSNGESTEIKFLETRLLEGDFAEHSRALWEQYGASDEFGEDCALHEKEPAE